ncbi:shikimate dehydrogenase [Caldicellulosiruptoraceae bacterium PP1]
MKFYLLGKSLKHSISPLIHSYFYNKLNINATYSNLEIADESLIADFIQKFKIDEESLGFNITIPYKENILNFVNEISEDVSIIGASNCVYKKDNKLVAENTDWIGFIKGIEHKNIDFINKTILLIGAGGASRSIIYALHKLKVKKVILTNRTYENALKFVEIYKNFIDIEPIKWHNFYKKPIDIIINTTPIGMGEFIDISPLDSIPNNVQFVFDAIYNPYETKLIKLAKEMNIDYLNGLHMLIYQAAESYKYWLNISIPDNVMNQAFEYAKIYLYKSV